MIFLVSSFNEDLQAILYLQVSDILKVGQGQTQNYKGKK